MFRRILATSSVLPVALLGRQQRLFAAPTPTRLNASLEENDGDEFDVFEDDDMWFMEELLGEGGEMDFVIPSEDARMLQGEKQ